MKYKTKKTFGENIREFRKEMDYNMAEVADGVGCSITEISDMERGIRFPDKHMAENILVFLGMGDRSNYPLSRLMKDIAEKIHGHMFDSNGKPVSLRDLQIYLSRK